MKKDWTYIIIHCSDTEDSGTVSWPAIKKYHTMVRGWSDIGYHAGVELTGTDYEALIGRRWDTEGAHCASAGRNHDSLGICLVGSFEKTPPPPAQIEVARDRIILPWMDLFGIKAENIMFHRDFANYKTCPGKAFTKAYLAQFIPGVKV